MQTLSLAHFQTIEYVIKGGDYNYISAHLPVDLPPEDASLFARILIDGNSAQWFVEDKAEYKCLSEASPDDRLAALQDLKVRKERILARLAGKVKYAELLFVIPDEDQIFFTRREGVVRALLCQWGFRRRNDPASNDIISFLLDSTPDPPASVDVRFQALYSDGKPAAGLPLTLDWAVAKDFVTDAEGIWVLGSMLEGTAFSIQDASGRRFDFTVQPGVDVYEAVFPLSVDYRIRVVNQEDTPKPDYPLEVQGVTLRSDADAMVYPEKVLLGPSTEVEVSDETGHVEHYRLEREGNDFTFVVTDHFSSSLRVRCVWDDGTPVGNCRVLVDQEEMVTDENGILVLSDLAPDRTMTVAPADNLTDSHVVTLERGENEVEIIREKEKPKMVRIRIRDYDGVPLPKIHVRLNLAKGPYEADTDEEGCIFLPETLFMDKEKVRFNFDYERPDKKRKKNS